MLGLSFPPADATFDASMGQLNLEGAKRVDYYLDAVRWSGDFSG